jgi:hypothetical protein
MITLAVERLFDCMLNPTVAGPTFGDVQGVGPAVGPQAEKVTDPVGDPAAEVPVTVAVSTAVLLSSMVDGLSAVVSVGVIEPVEVVASRHSVLVSLSLTAL